MGLNLCFIPLVYGMMFLYQVSVVLYNFAAYIDNQQLDFVLGTDFFEPCFLQDDDEPIYPEMDLD